MPMMATGTEYRYIRLSIARHLQRRPPRYPRSYLRVPPRITIYSSRLTRACPALWCALRTADPARPCHIAQARATRSSPSTLCASPPQPTGSTAHTRHAQSLCMHSPTPAVDDPTSRAMPDTSPTNPNCRSAHRGSQTSSPLCPRSSFSLRHARASHPQVVCHQINKLSAERVAIARDCCSVDVARRHVLHANVEPPTTYQRLFV